MAADSPKPVWQTLLMMLGSLGCIYTGFGWLGVIGGWHSPGGVVANVGGALFIATGVSGLLRFGSELQQRYRSDR
jgi:hypothetical protein